ncbi:type II toxin-antitoxin system VapC family toxin [Acidocella aromatica]|uniref:PIN domain nuclease of toxin-antitoxin system n=1 Tax=Acidocella aromatica TaxID=1303579 RepID=A0A840VCX8_9PROT|nr:type II toxin-antitoxin system VapC family toxin [Acidocella aromatica]MBB5372707.1 PIN domain nuclease of toxin-antitoxin system [Acidocella aromatica]
MRLLLDTHLLLWALAEPDRLDATTRTALEDAGNEVLFSAASLWEIAIKAGLGRPDFAFEPRQILCAALDTGFVELPVHADAAILVAKLPPHHRDPFDRLLIAQAMSEPVRFYTADPVLPPYSELVTLVG